MDQFLRWAFRTIVKRGRLQVTTSRGTGFTVGDGTGTPVAVRFISPRAERAVLLNPELKLGEAFMDGTFVVEQGSIADFFRLILSQDRMNKGPHWARPRARARQQWRRLQQHNPRRRAQRNVSHHYDLDARLYSLFLDSDRQYSCAYFESPTATLDDAQLAKKRHLAAKLLLREPGKRVLDIGSGWGGLALYLAEVARARVTGITLSHEQLDIARGRAGELGLDVEFRLQDYRDVTERYDRIVSVGMFEHVGVGFYPAFFRKSARMLTDDGVMVLHSIGRSEGPSSTNPWISKYIFPGGYIPALSEVLPAIERAGLLVTDIEILRLHYAETLKAWRERFLAHREDAERLYDPRFVRMWEFYLAGAEMSFREQNLMVFQIQLTKQQGVVPIARGYIAEEEERFRALEAKTRAPLRLAGE
ncbi:MAG TPA: cyclopropane-fatty-acyl-phospholipid synthase family protein [Xanthobacteraceae bacterium]|jgi:cyclopropane-fatty-acyl-phospholipid synthase|nr:cyclopropane-fatty-acyl-phospholipid synthase family protein [Xanthobacteraceae bacterium]